MALDPITITDEAGCTAAAAATRKMNNQQSSDWAEPHYRLHRRDQEQRYEEYDEVESAANESDVQSHQQGAGVYGEYKLQQSRSSLNLSNPPHEHSYGGAGGAGIHNVSSDVGHHHPHPAAEQALFDASREEDPASIGKWAIVLAKGKICPLYMCVGFCLF